MAVYLVSSEPRGRTLQHSEEPSAGVVLCTKEYADEHTLMHYRVGGEKKGVRRWQNENGSYTKAGYEHYAEMYGWNKLRADHADRRAEINRRKASDAKLRLDKATVKYDKAEIKSNKRGDAVSAAKRDAARRKMSEAQYQYDTYSAKANKWQAKSDKIHEKWDKKQEKIASREEKAELDKKAGANFDEDKTTVNAGESSWSKDEIRKIAEAEADDFYSGLGARQNEAVKRLKERGEDYDNSDAVVNEMHKIEDEQYEKSKKELGPERRREIDVYKYTGEHGWNKQNQRDLLNEVMAQPLGDLSPAKREELGNAWLDLMNTRYNGKPYPEESDDEFYELHSALWDEVDRVAGNENTGEFVEGSNSKKAHQKLAESYDKTWSRRLELEREAGIDHNRALTYTKDYKRLKKVLDSDQIYKALAENDKKNEEALLSAVLKDLGFSDTPANRSAIFPIVFRD